MNPSLLVPMHFSDVFDPPPSFFSETRKYSKIAKVGAPGSKI
jgi:hypothetical protein